MARKNVPNIFNQPSTPWNPLAKVASPVLSKSRMPLDDGALRTNQMVDPYRPPVVKPAPRTANPDANTINDLARQMLLGNPKPASSPKNSTEQVLSFLRPEQRAQISGGGGYGFVEDPMFTDLGSTTTEAGIKKGFVEDPMFTALGSTTTGAGIRKAPNGALSGGAGGSGGGGGGGSPGVDVGMAEIAAQQGPSIDERIAQILGLKYDPQIAAVDQQLKQLGIDTERANATQQGYQRIVTPQLAQLFGGLESSLGADKTVYDTQAADLNQRLAQYYQDAQNQISSSGDTVRNKIAAEAQRLGLAPAIQGPGYQNLAENQQIAQNTLGTAKASSMSNFDTLTNSLSALAGQDVSTAKQSGAQAQSDIASQVANALAEISLEASKQRGGYQANRTSLEAQRGAEVPVLMQQLQQQDLERMLALKGDAREDAKLQLAIASAGGGGGGGGGGGRSGSSSGKYPPGTPLEAMSLPDQLKYLDVQAKIKSLSDPNGNFNENNPMDQANLALANQKLSATPTYEGSSGLEKWFNSDQPEFWSEAGAGPKFRAGVQALLNDKNILTQPGNVNNNIRASIPQYAKDKNLNPRALQTALDIYTKRY